MNPLHELSRFELVRARVGHDQALAFVAKAYKSYMRKLREYRVGFGVTPSIRENLIRSAYSFRYILRNQSVLLWNTGESHLLKRCQNCRHEVANPTAQLHSEADAQWLKCLGIYPRVRQSVRPYLPLWSMRVIPIVF